MASCRSVDRPPLAPLADFLRGTTKREIQSLMMEVMPILTVPNLNKEQLIDQLIDHVRSSGSLADVCKIALKGPQEGLLAHDTPTVRPQGGK